MTTLHHEIRTFCSVHKLKLNKELGQHYLINEEILNAIVDAANIQTSDHIVEIGPGIGVLTRELLTKAREVTAIELDERIVPLLRMFTDRLAWDQEPKEGAKLTVLEQNALQVDMPNEPYKIVANIPYHITSPLLHHVFLESSVPATSLTLLIQKEVAENICPPSGRAGDTKNAGILTILVALFGKPRIVCNAPPKAFFPPPKVDSAVLHIDCFAEPIADRKTIEQIFKFTKIAFSQKRKMIRNTIGSLPNGMEMLKKAKIDPMRRPQTLGIEEWMRLVDCL